MIAITKLGAAAAALPHWRKAQRSVAKHPTPTALDALGAAARAAGERRPTAG